jgi:hypothetical protein
MIAVGAGDWFGGGMLVAMGRLEPGRIRVLKRCYDWLGLRYE